VISLHVPATPQTANLLSVDAFDRMKPGVVIINTARGALIDNRALISALRSGRVAGAGLDVLPEEPLMRLGDRASAAAVEHGRLAAVELNRTLCAMPNVVVTPHSAFYTREALRRIAATTIENIDGFCRGAPKNLVAGTGASAPV
jgi:D-lactate dehydrogenase